MTVGLAVVVDKSRRQVVHIGDSNQTGLLITPQWLERKVSANPATYQILNTDHYTGRDEAVTALLWIVEDLFNHIRGMERRWADQLAASSGNDGGRGGL